MRRAAITREEANAITAACLLLQAGLDLLERVHPPARASVYELLDCDEPNGDPLPSSMSRPDIDRLLHESIPGAQVDEVCCILAAQVRAAQRRLNALCAASDRPFVT